MPRFQLYLPLLLAASTMAVAAPPLAVEALPGVGDGVSLRGIASRGAEVVWVSGTGGTALRSGDGGASFRSAAPPETAELDFRDVALLGDRVALLLSVGPGGSSRIYRTDDGGAGWRLVLQNDDEAAFFNAMAFWDGRSGVVTSDSADGRLLLLATADGGESWRRIGADTLPPLLSGEAGFAASGTTLAVAGQSSLWVATGGGGARVFRSADRGATWEVSGTPLPSGAPSAGVFSVAFRDQLHGVVVGGDYRDPERDDGNVAWTRDAGASWERGASDAPFTQKACVHWLGAATYLAAGRLGLALSDDDGHSWRRLEAPPYYTIAFDHPSGVGFLAGSEGRIGRFRWTGATSKAVGER